MMPLVQLLNNRTLVETVFLTVSQLTIIVSNRLFIALIGNLQKRPPRGRFLYLLSISHENGSAMLNKNIMNVYQIYNKGRGEG